VERVVPSIDMRGLGATGLFVVGETPDIGETRFGGRFPLLVFLPITDNGTDLVFILEGDGEFADFGEFSVGESILREARLDALVRGLILPGDTFGETSYSVVSEDLLTGRPVPAERR